MSFEFLNTLKVLDVYKPGGYSFSIDVARVEFPCAHCGDTLTIKVAETEAGDYAYFCPRCMKPSVKWVDDKGKSQYAPIKQPSKAPMGTPNNIVDAWIEGERCFYAGAYNAAAMVYRKLIFLVAVDCGMPPKNENGRAPNFDVCLDHLLLEEYITGRGRKTWAETIRSIGNDAVHEIEPITENQARDSRSFIFMILKLVYEYEELAQKDC